MQLFKENEKFKIRLEHLKFLLRIVLRKKKPNQILRVLFKN